MTPGDTILQTPLARGGAQRAIAIDASLRPFVLPLWRRELVEIWYRQAPDAHPSLQGPYYALTIAGARIASSIIPAPRGFSGAEKRRW